MERLLVLTVSIGLAVLIASCAAQLFNAAMAPALKVLM